jgi:hypothetical protein
MHVERHGYPLLFIDQGRPMRVGEMHGYTFNHHHSIVGLSGLLTHSSVGS